MHILIARWHDQHENLDPRKVKIDEKLHKNILIYGQKL